MAILGLELVSGGGQWIVRARTDGGLQDFFCPTETMARSMFARLQRADLHSRPAPVPDERTPLPRVVVAGR